jgi:hypothetical protein
VFRNNRYPNILLRQCTFRAGFCIVICAGSLGFTTMQSSLGRARAGSDRCAEGNGCADTTNHAPIDHPARLFLPQVALHARAIGGVLFNVERGFYDQPIHVTLSTSTAGAIVRYTTDGSLPSENHGLVYDKPLHISTTTVLRAAAIRPGRSPAPVTTQTYILPTDTIHQSSDQPGLPTTWGSYAGEPFQADYAMDTRIVDDPRYAPLVAEALRDVPSLSIALDPDDLFGATNGIYVNGEGRGVNWERAASVELIRDDGRPGFQIDFGLRVSGQASRLPEATLKKSFSLRFTSRHGPTKLEYPLFLDSPVQSFDSVRLRGMLNDSFSYFPLRGQLLRDQWGRETQLNMGHLAPRGMFVHLYLNGLYWGLYNLSEEVTDSFMAAHLGGRRGEYDVIKSVSADGIGNGVEDGDRAAYERLISILGVADKASYQQVAKQLDLAQHADYILLQIYSANSDWPHSNWRAARHRTQGSKFVFFAWDMEATLDLIPPADADGDTRFLDIAETSGVDDLHGRLRDNPEYRLLFADRAHKHLRAGGPLSPEHAGQLYADLAAEIERPVIAESARWGDAVPGAVARTIAGAAWDSFWARKGPGQPQTRDGEWAPERDRLLRDFFPHRTAVVLEQLCREGLYPQLVAPAIDATADDPPLRIQLKRDALGLFERITGRHCLLHDRRYRSTPSMDGRTGAERPRLPRARVAGYLQQCKGAYTRRRHVECHGGGRVRHAPHSDKRDHVPPSRRRQRVPRDHQSGEIDCRSNRCDLQLGRNPHLRGGYVAGAWRIRSRRARSD